MKHLALTPPGGPISLLVVGAHADDIEIGCGGTILRLLDEHPGSSVVWLVLSADGGRRAEAAAAAERFLEQAGARDVRIADLPDSRFPTTLNALKDTLESFKAGRHDVIFCPRVEDAHQDHRATGQAVWQTFRDHLVLEYEIPKYDGDLGRPSVFVDLPEPVARRKIDLLLDLYPSQRERHWYDAETFSAILRLRGVEAGTRYAEAFDCRKLLV
jgi:LmbE family N-acetylglucosaminyl deacetylase